MDEPTKEQIEDEMRWAEWVQQQPENMRELYFKERQISRLPKHMQCDAWAAYSRGKQLDAEEDALKFVAVLFLIGAAIFVTAQLLTRLWSLL